MTLASATDPFLKRQALQEKAPKPVRTVRPKALQIIVGTFGDILAAEHSPMMAKHLGFKIFQMLQDNVFETVEKSNTSGKPLSVQTAGSLKTLQRKRGRWAELADALDGVVDGLDWYTGTGGPYASVNFEHGHAHAMLIGPGGLESRPDVILGLTILAPYTRFPDFDHTHSRIVIPLGKGEFRSGDDDWQQRDVGAVIFCPDGNRFAMRCTAQPLLVMWAQKLLP